MVFFAGTPLFFKLLFLATSKMKPYMDRRCSNFVPQNNMEMARKQKNGCDYQSAIGNIALTRRYTIARLCKLVSLGGEND